MTTSINFSPQERQALELLLDGELMPFLGNLEKTILEIALGRCLLPDSRIAFQRKIADRFHLSFLFLYVGRDLTSVEPGHYLPVRVVIFPDESLGDWLRQPVANQMKEEILQFAPFSYSEEQEILPWGGTVSEQVIFRGLKGMCREIIQRRNRPR